MGRKTGAESWPRQVPSQVPLISTPNLKIVFGNQNFGGFASRRSGVLETAEGLWAMSLPRTPHPLNLPSSQGLISQNLLIMKPKVEQEPVQEAGAAQPKARPATPLGKCTLRASQSLHYLGHI